MDYETFKEIMSNEAPIYIDTNCLLELYRLPVNLVSTFIDGIYEKDLIDLFRISSTVKKEFGRNSHTIGKDSGKKYNDNLEDIKRSIEKINSKIKRHVSYSSRCNNPAQSISAEDLKSKTDLLISDIKKINKIDASKVIDNANKTKIDKFISNLFNSSNVIEEPDQREVIDLITEGYTRVKHNIPPGFKDKTKYHDKKKSVAKNGNVTLNQVDLTEYLGDFFIWKDILGDSIDDEKEWKLFVTGDLKEDWFIIPADKKLENYIPREELIKEFKCYHDSSIELEFLPFDLFVQYMIQFAGNIDFESFFSTNVVTDIEDDIIALVESSITPTIESDLIDDGNINKGFRVDDWEVEIDPDSIEIGDSSIVSSEVTSQESDMYYVRFDVETDFVVGGEFSVYLEMDGDFIDNVRGDFYVNSGTVVYSTDIGFSITNIDTRTENEKNIENVIPMMENKKIEKIIIIEDYEGLDFENIFINPGGLGYDEYPSEEEIYENQY